MSDWRSIAVGTGTALLLAFSAAGCTSGNEHKSAERDTSVIDRDPRNNENDSLGAKSLPPADALPPHDSVDKTEFHFNSRLSMNRALSERLRNRVPELETAYVALTESNAYAAVKLRRPRAQNVTGAAADPELSRPDGLNGAGLFGMGDGLKLDWQSQDGLTTELQTKIAAALHEFAPSKANLFVSSNPNYVRRMKYYFEQSHSGTSMNHFINEFNTMAYYTFPYSTNAGNSGSR